MKNYKITEGETDITKTTIIDFDDYTVTAKTKNDEIISIQSIKTTSQRSFFFGTSDPDFKVVIETYLIMKNRQKNNDEE